MTYTLTVNNVGTAEATDIKVVDTVPAGLTEHRRHRDEPLHCARRPARR